jgi:single stranded DNA-binding protein
MTHLVGVLKPLVSVTALFVGIVYLLAFTSQNRARHRFDSVCPSIGTQTSIRLPNQAIILAEISCHPRELSTGLMNRNTLPANRGMLFIYQKPGHHRHWMYRCPLPLDIIWLDRARRIVEIRSDAPPCQSSFPFTCPMYGTTKEAKYVLELDAGAARAAGSTCMTSSTSPLLRCRRAVRQWIPQTQSPKVSLALWEQQGTRFFGRREKTRAERSIPPMYLNRIQLIGFTGKDAESRTIRNTQRVSFSVATSESWHDENGDWQKKTEWHNCIVWGGKLADFARTLEAGSYLLVEGKLVKREYDREIQAGKGAVKVPATAVEIIANKIVKLARPTKNSNVSESTERPYAVEENAETAIA